MLLPRCDTVPLTGATVGVPIGESMSTPLWARPPERAAPQVSLKATGPCTGQTIPPTGALATRPRSAALGRGALRRWTLATRRPPRRRGRPPRDAGARPPGARCSSASRRSNSRSRAARRSSSSAMASFCSLALGGQLVLGDLEVFGGGLVGVDGVLVALGGVLRQRVGPGLGVDVGIGVAVLRRVAADEPPHGGVAHGVAERVERGLRGRRPRPRATGSRRRARRAGSRRRPGRRRRRWRAGGPRRGRRRRRPRWARPR